MPAILHCLPRQYSSPSRWPKLPVTLRDEPSFIIDSRTGAWHVGNPLDLRTVAAANASITCDGRGAQLNTTFYQFDWLSVMDDSNLANACQAIMCQMTLQLSSTNLRFLTLINRGGDLEDLVLWRC